MAVFSLRFERKIPAVSHTPRQHQTFHADFVQPVVLSLASCKHFPWEAGLPWKPVLISGTPDTSLSFDFAFMSPLISCVLRRHAGSITLMETVNERSSVAVGIVTSKRWKHLPDVPHLYVKMDLTTQTMWFKVLDPGS